MGRLPCKGGENLVAYIRDIEDINIYTALIGCNELGIEVCRYKNINEVPITKDTLIIGSISDYVYAMKKLDIKVEPMDYPKELNNYYYLGRKIYKTTLGEVKNTLNVFIKPVDCKLFTGFVNKNEWDILRANGVSDDTEVWCSSLVPFESEYRCFVRYGEIMGVKHYSGDPYKALDKLSLGIMVGKMPKRGAYTLDVGVVWKRNYLVEANDFYAIGSYGLDSIVYVLCLIARWCELVGRVDEYEYIKGKDIG